MNFLKMLFLISFICLQRIVLAQLVQQTSPTFLDLNSVDFCDELNGYACGGKVVKTSDGGSNWSLVSYSGVNSASFNSTIFYQVKVFTPQKIILFGQDDFLNQCRIFLTTDGGVIWNDVSIILTGRGLRAAHFSDINTGYAVGLGGTVLKTVDGGATWVDVPNSISYNFTGVHFTNASIGFAVGNNIVAKTVNGGSSWQTTFLPSSQLNAISFGNTNTGYVSGSDGKIYKTTNAGGTWTSLPSPFNTNVTIKAWSKDTVYSVSNSCLTVAHNGASSWDKFSFPNQFNAITLINSQRGYIVGGSGIIYKFTGGAGTTKPISYFTYPTLLGCEGKSIVFTNQGDPSYTYQWFLNSSLQSTNYSTSITFPAPGNQVVKLIAYNGFFYDTSSVVVNVQSKPVVNPFNSTVLIDTLCPNNYSIIDVPLSQPGVLYTLRKGIVPVTSATTKSGNGSTLSFLTPYINVTTVFNMRAWRVSSCDTTELIKYDTVYVDQLATPTDPVIPTKNPICPGKSTFMEIHSSDSGIWYRLKKNGVFMNDSVMGNGSTVTLPTGSMITPATFIVTARNHSNCINQLSTSPTISITPISANYSIKNPLAIVGDTLVFDNSIVKGDSLFWDFGLNAIFSSDTAHNPIVTYTTTGTQQIQLITKTIDGCYDTAKKDVSMYNLANKGVGKLCMGNTLPYTHHSPLPGYNVLAFHVDKHGNTYMGGYIETSSLLSQILYDMFIIKMDPAGNISWNKNQKIMNNSYSDYKSSFITGITTDSSGNIYVTGSFAASRITMDTIVLTYTSVQPQGFVAKLSPSGITQWALTARTTATYGFGGGSDIICTDNNKLFVSLVSITTNPKELLLPDKSVILLPDTSELFLLQINTQGKLIKINTVNNKGHYAAITQYNPHPAVWYTFMITTISPKIKVSKTGKICMVGSFGKNYQGKQNLVFGNTTIDTLVKGPNGFIAILDPASGWENAFTTYGLNFVSAYIPVFTVDDSNNVYIGTPYGVNAEIFPSLVSMIKFNDGNLVTGEGYSIMKYNSAGQILWHKENPKIFARSFDIIPSGEILLFGEFKDFWGFNSTGNGPQGIRSTGDNDIFFAGMKYNGELLWARNFGSTTPENALFMQVDKCSGDFCLSGGLNSKSVLFDTYTFTNTINNLFIARYSPDSVCAKNPPCFDPIYTPVQEMPLDLSYTMFHTYPNPNNGTFTIETKEKSCEFMISNVFGERILSQRIKNEKVEIDLSKESNGIYFLQLKSEGRISTQKLIISR